MSVNKRPLPLPNANASAVDAKSADVRKWNDLARAAPPLSGVVQRKCACGNRTMARSECEECSKKKQTLQRKPSPSQGDGRSECAVPHIVHEVLRSPGQPVDSDTLALFEPRFGYDFSQVRVHTDAKAAKSARAVNALAYTVGRNIVFGAFQYAPETSAGQRLLAHELTHTVQQSAASIPAMLAVEAGGSALEHEADRIADRVTSAPAGVAQIPGAGSAPATAMRSPQGVAAGHGFSHDNDHPSISTARIASLQRQRRGAAGGCGICMNDPRGRRAGDIAHIEVQEAFTAANPDIVPEREVPGVPGTGVDLSYERSQHGQHVIFIGEIKPYDDAGQQADIGRAKLQDYARELQFSYDEVFYMRDSPPPGPLFFENEMNPPGCPPQVINMQRTEPGLYQYYCEPPWSQLVRDPRCRCTRRKEEEPEPSAWFDYWKKEVRQQQKAGEKGEPHEAAEEVEQRQREAAYIALLVTAGSYAVFKYGPQLGTELAQAAGQLRAAAPRFALAVPGSAVAPPPTSVPPVATGPAPAPPPTSVPPAAGGGSRLAALGARAGIAGIAVGASLGASYAIAKYFYEEIYEGTRGWKIKDVYKRLGAAAEAVGGWSGYADELLWALEQMEQPDAADTAALRAELFDALNELRRTIAETGKVLQNAANDFSAISDQLDLSNQYQREDTRKAADDIIASGSQSYADLWLLYTLLSEMVDWVAKQIQRLVDNQRAVFKRDVEYWGARQR